MLIRMRRNGGPALEQPDNLREFKLVAEAVETDLPALQAAFAPAGRIENAQHAWVDPAWLRAQAPMRDDPAWQVGFGKMVDFARSKGWVGADGAIRAHIEWQG